MSITLEVRIDDREVRALLDQLGARARDLTAPMKLIARQMQFSVDQNFKVGGRPRWLVSERAERQGGQTLVDTRRLQSSITADFASDRVEIGTNVIYGRVHQLGFLGMVQVPAHVRLLKQGALGKTLKLSARTKSGRQKTKRLGTYVHVQAHDRLMKIFPRPFLVVQDADQQLAVQTIRDYLLRRV